MAIDIKKIEGLDSAGALAALGGVGTKAKKWSKVEGIISHVLSGLGALGNLGMMGASIATKGKIPFMPIGQPFGVAGNIFGDLSKGNEEREHEAGAAGSLIQSGLDPMQSVNVTNAGMGPQVAGSVVKEKLAPDRSAEWEYRLVHQYGGDITR